MKRFTYLFCGLIVLAAMTSCNQDEPQKPAESQSYTMTIQATKGTEAESDADGSVKRVLSLGDHTLTASWAVGEKVTVHNNTTGADLEGYLEAQSSGTSTTLSGTLTGTISNGDELKLMFLSPSYSTQDGTLEYISTHCDYADALVTVTDASTPTVSTTAATFINRQAIVKFALKKKADNSNFEIPAATALTVSDGTNDYTVTPSLATNVLFVALPATNTVKLSKDLNGFKYYYEKTNTNLIEAGKYYEITVKMSPRLAVKHGDANYTEVTNDIILGNGDIVTGTLFDNLAISIAPDATVTLSDVTINGGHTCAGITCQTNATITLLGSNTIQAPASGHPGIKVGNGTLTINGSGSLTVFGGADAAGIGSCPTSPPCGNINIVGGTIDATGGTNAAGIGCGAYNNCGTITIANTVSITARKGTGAPNSIGAAVSSPGSSNSYSGTITIGGIVYWGETESGSKIYEYKNGGDTYLTQDELTYTPQN